jgi:hypothetical protein
LSRQAPPTIIEGGATPQTLRPVDVDTVILPSMMNQLKGKIPTWVEDRMNYLRTVTPAHWTADDWMMLRRLDAQIKGENPVTGSGIFTPESYAGKRAEVDKILGNNSFPPGTRGQGPKGSAEVAPEIVQPGAAPEVILPERAEGGPVQEGKPYLVGEKGPEIIVPKTNGAVIPNDRAAMEAYFKASPWYSEFKQNYGVEPDFNTKDYDYMAAFKAGIKPSRDPYDIGPNPVTGLPAPEGGRYHWASKTPEGLWLKNPETHPTAWMETFMEQTGKNPESLGLKTREQGDQYINQMRLQKLNILLKGAAQ